MLLNDIVELAIESTEECSVYDFETEETIFAGDVGEIPDEFLDREIASWGMEKGRICFNLADREWE